MAGVKAVSDALNAVLDRLDNVRETGPGQYQASCPHHEDRNPSLSVSEGDTQPVVFNCHAGCDRDHILAELGLQWSDLCDGDVVTEADFEQAPWKHGEKVATYHYRDESGEKVYRVERYERPEHGWKSFRPYLPGNKRAGLGKQRRVLYRLPSVIEHARDGGVLFVVEGEKDVHTLENHGFTATTSGSSDTWKDRFSEWVSGAKVVVIPDNDESGRDYAKDVARSCRQTAEWVRVLHLEDVPSGGDVTDWFARGHERDELADAVEETENWTPNMGARGDGVAGEVGIEATGGPWDKVRALYEADKKAEGRLKAAKTAVRELAFATHRASGTLYAFDEDEKVLQKGGDSALGELLLGELGIHHSRHEHKEIRAKVKALTYRDEIGGGKFIPVANGDLELQGPDHKPHLKEVDPQRAPLHRAPAVWDSEAKCPLWEDHLRANVPDPDERDTLQEYAGYTLMHWRLPFHKALFLVGPTASGKSTTLNVLRDLFAEVASVEPQHLVDSRFGPIELEGAWANIRSDINSALLKNIGRFKEMVAGEPMYAERKYQQGYEFTPTAKHLYAANRLPEVAIDDDAFYRRILIVSFPRTIPRKDREPRMDEALRDELDGVLRWAVTGLQRVLENGGFTHDLSPQETRRRWEEHGSSIGRFKAACLNVTGDSDDLEPKGDLFSAYTDFCRRNGLSTDTQQELTRTLKRDPRVSDAHRTPAPGEGQTRCYVGLSLQKDRENRE